MHSKKVVHKDIKIDNLLLFAYPHKLQVKISDFGLSKELLTGSGTQQSTLGAGTLVFMAPELRNGARAHTPSDVFALGMTGVEILTREPSQVMNFVGQINAAASAATTQLQEENSGGYSNA